VPRYLLQLRGDQRYASSSTRAARGLPIRERRRHAPFCCRLLRELGQERPQKVREGDEKTPIGVYHITASLPDKASGFYGSGAFPINYPNEWIAFRPQRPCIWLHGTPSNTYSRPPRSSNGCVVLANSDLEQIARKLQVGVTPVIISEEVQWLSLDDWTSERNSLERALERWRADWESLDTDRYLAHYSADFSAQNADLDGWSRHKRMSTAARPGSKSKSAISACSKTRARQAWYR